MKYSQYDISYHFHFDCHLPFKHKPSTTTDIGVILERSILQKSAEKREIEQPYHHH